MLLHNFRELIENMLRLPM